MLIDGEFGIDEEGVEEKDEDVAPVSIIDCEEGKEDRLVLSDEFEFEFKFEFEFEKELD